MVTSATPLMIPQARVVHEPKVDSGVTTTDASLIPAHGGSVVHLVELAVAVVAAVTMAAERVRGVAAAAEAAT
jgi:hypothetical protein